MGIHPIDLLEFIIRPTLKKIGFWSEASEKLLLYIAGIESKFGNRLKQMNGPALGIYQMEPATHKENWSYILNHRPILRIKISNYYGLEFNDEKLIYDLSYATMMARAHFLRFKEPIPDENDILGLANYWKKYYNTLQGKGNILDFIEIAKRIEL
jgi:hypothetical protein